MNRYERKQRSRRMQERRFLRYAVHDGLAYKSMRDYIAHPEDRLQQRRANPPESRYWHHHTRVNIWKACQKRHANKRIRILYSGHLAHDESSLPRFAGYKRVHELVIY